MADIATFHPFPRLPIELRLKIWLVSLPSRVVEPEIDCDCKYKTTSSYHSDNLIARLIFGEHNRGLQKPRHIPGIFTVNSESRGFCLEQYISFAGTYIHPTLDILLFSTDDEKRFWLHSPSFYHLPDHPVAKLQRVAIEVEYEKPDTDFSGHLHWMRGLGCPQELIICPAPSREETLHLLADHYRSISGTIRIIGSDGNRAQLVKWPINIEGEAVQQIKPKLLQALREEKMSKGNFQIPAVGDDLYFAYSDPEFWVVGLGSSSYN